MWSDAGGGCGGGLEVLGGVGEGEGLAGEGAEVRGLEGLGAGDGISGFGGLHVTGCGDEQESVLGVCGVGLEPALGEVAWVLMGGVAGAFGGGEAGGDDGMAVEDAEVGFVLCEVAIGALGDGVEDGGVVLVLQERAVGMQEGRWRCGGIAEGSGVAEGGDAVPLAVLGHEDGADQVLVELYGQDGVELGGVAEGYEVKTDRVRKGNVTADEVLAGSGDVGEGGGAHAVVGGLEFDGERLRCGDSGVGGGELDRPEPDVDGIEDGGLLNDDWLRWRCGGWRGPNVVTLGRGCAHCA